MKTESFVDPVRSAASHPQLFAGLLESGKMFVTTFSCVRDELGCAAHYALTFGDWSAQGIHRVGSRHPGRRAVSLFGRRKEIFKDRAQAKKFVENGGDAQLRFMLLS